ncbi:MAG: ribbon-helix-helix protein, CopG family [Planctomycetes bacterium]|nr:ribbon-helix-helix protein, CopG family [Planctomycetota bacterium]
MRTTEIVSLSFPPTLLRQIERRAKKEGRTKSALFREAVRRYLLESEVRELARYGARRARRLGLRRSDIQRLIEEYRRGR